MSVYECYKSRTTVEDTRIAMSVIVQHAWNEIVMSDGLSGGHVGYMSGYERGAGFEPATSAT